MENFLDIAIQAAIEAGCRIMDIYNNADFAVEYKSDNSPITQADKQAHRAIVSLLNITGFPVISEEGIIPDYAFRKNRMAVWMVDPLDGTKEFINRNGEFTVNIALIENGKPTLGVVYLPTKNLMYYGCEGTGSFCTTVAPEMDEEALLASIDQAKKLNVKTADEQYLILASRSHMNANTTEYIDKLKEEHPNAEIISGGSSLKFCLIAEGFADIYPRLSTTCEWDTAAGHAILSFAGGSVIDYETGESLKYNKEELLNPWFIAKAK